MEKKRINDGDFQYDLIDWDTLSKYRGKTAISSAKLNSLIDRKRFPNEKFKLQNIFSEEGKKRSYDVLRNNGHDFVQHCLKLVGHPKTNKSITIKPEIIPIVKNRIKKITENHVYQLVNKLRIKLNNLSISSISYLNNTISPLSSEKDINDDSTNDFGEDVDLIDESALDMIFDNWEYETNGIDEEDEDDYLESEANEMDEEDEDEYFEPDANEMDEEDEDEYLEPDANEMNDGVQFDDEEEG